MKKVMPSVNAMIACKVKVSKGQKPQPFSHSSRTCGCIRANYHEFDEAVDLVLDERVRPLNLGGRPGNLAEESVVSGEKADTCGRAYQTSVMHTLGLLGPMHLENGQRVPFVKLQPERATFLASYKVVWFASIPSLMSTFSPVSGALFTFSPTFQPSWAVRS
jgi:hypothetical protein